MTAADFLARIEARANAATEGPWDVASDADTYLKPTDVVGPGEPGERFIICEYAGQDAEFIAHARADVPALVAALRAVLDRVDIEVRDARRGIEYAAEVNQGVLLASEEARERAWQAVGRVIEKHLGGEPR